MEPLREIVVRRQSRLPILEGDLRLLSVESLSDELTEIYQSHRWVHDKLREQESSTEIRGRHPLVIGEVGGETIAVKRVFHGGAAAGILGDRWATPRRALKVVEAAGYLRARSIATPRPLFVAWVRSLGFVRSEIGFERLLGSDADRLLFGDGSVPIDGFERMSRVGRFVASLHQNGFEHGDLNLMNLFFTENEEIQILDLDKCELRGEPLSGTARENNLARLERSVRKQCRIHGHPDILAEEMVRALRQGYGEAVKRN